MDPRSVRPTNIVTDCWRTVKSRAPPVVTRPSPTHRYYTDQYKPAAAPCKRCSKCIILHDGNGGSFRRRSLGADGHSLRGANVDIRRKCHGRRYHVTTVPSLTAAAAAAAAGGACPMTLLNDRSLNYYSFKMLRRRHALPLARTFIWHLHVLYIHLYSPWKAAV